MKYKINLLKYLLLRFKSFQSIWNYAINQKSLYSIAYEVRRVARYRVFNELILIMFYGTNYIKTEIYDRIFERIFLSGCMEVIK